MIVCPVVFHAYEGCKTACRLHLTSQSFRCPQYQGFGKSKARLLPYALNWPWVHAVMLYITIDGRRRLFAWLRENASM